MVVDTNSPGQASQTDLLVFRFDSAVQNKSDIVTALKAANFGDQYLYLERNIDNFECDTGF